MNGYIDTDSILEKVERKQVYKLRLSTLYGISGIEPCNVELKIHRTMTATQLINILSDLDDILPNCDISINIKK